MLRARQEHGRNIPLPDIDWASLAQVAVRAGVMELETFAASAATQAADGTNPSKASRRTDAIAHGESRNGPRPRQHQRRSNRSAPGPEGIPAAEPLRRPRPGGEPPDDKAGLRQAALRRLVAHPGRPDQSQALLLRGR